jgi:hypothetical protein
MSIFQIDCSIVEHFERSMCCFGPIAKDGNFLAAEGKILGTVELNPGHDIMLGLNGGFQLDRIAMGQATLLLTMITKTEPALCVEKVTKSSLRNSFTLLAGSGEKAIPDLHWRLQLSRHTWGSFKLVNGIGLLIEAGAQLLLLFLELVDRTKLHLFRTFLAFQAQGRKPYPIPVGGSNSLGTWGYIEAVQEIASQLKAGHVGDVDTFEDIVMACGSGGTTAGVAIASHLSGLKAKVHGYGVCDNSEYFYEYIQVG